MMMMTKTTDISWFAKALTFTEATSKGKLCVPFSNLWYLGPIFYPWVGWKDVMNVEFLYASRKKIKKKVESNIETPYPMYGYVWPLRYNWWIWFWWPYYPKHLLLHEKLFLLGSIIYVCTANITNLEKSSHDTGMDIFAQLLVCS